MNSDFVFGANSGVNSDVVVEVVADDINVALQAVFSFPTKEGAEKWMEELDWRVQAHHRVFKYDDESTSEESGTDTGRRAKRSKQHTGNKGKFSLTKKAKSKK